MLFGRTAEVAAEYLKKGSQVFIEGRLRTRKWQDKTGNDRYSTEIVGNDMQMLGGRGQGGGAGGGEGGRRLTAAAGAMLPAVALAVQAVGPAPAAGVVNSAMPPRPAPNTTSTTTFRSRRPPRLRMPAARRTAPARH